VDFKAAKDSFYEVTEFIGDLAINTGQIITASFKGKVKLDAFIQSSLELVFNVISPVFMISIAMGVVIGVQLGPEFVSRGLGNKLGILSAITMTRELIPVIGSMMIATQYGTGLAAEFANMKITEQIDALKVFRVDPMSYLVVPKFLAALFFVPVVLWLGSLLAITSTYVTVLITENVSLQGFLHSIWDYLKISDILICLFKSAVFGMLIVLIATTQGFSVEGGAKEVGIATTRTVIISFITIIAVDYLITFIYL